MDGIREIMGEMGFKEEDLKARERERERERKRGSERYRGREELATKDNWTSFSRERKMQDIL